MTHIWRDNRTLEKTAKTGKFIFIRKNITDCVKIMVTVAPYMEYPVEQGILPYPLLGAPGFDKPVGVILGPVLPALD